MKRREKRQKGGVEGQERGGNVNKNKRLERDKGSLR